jgi:uncharacterized MAPEG superfamily protein
MACRRRGSARPPSRPAQRCCCAWNSLRPEPPPQGTEWAAGESPHPAHRRRIEDAHANCLENLPIFAVIVLAAATLGRIGAVDALAPFVPYARIAQSLTHLSGVGPMQVLLVRAGFWAVQRVLFGWMMLRLIA